ncbi:NAD(P)-dependent oxidoreductase [Actinacidiphila paucisporea]|uniref:3-hydroxyisobutyrate dehydrogenase n=1 Tax=Actinacidiphila paucisporea TaxID=310782 RepID=A0A1M6XI64_9ACTN|nr:NAD(P)-dependent oxidoreductase [Actinacidiphila paucisporea]SHL05631.1 3-hydroxyisobutyrate dehydrogenase [Actinacidiphila paucisporea]
MSDSLTVAVLGTGLMGAGMARNLSAAGHDVRAWNRTPARARPLAADGVTVVTDPAEAVRGADAVVTMLLDGPATLEVVGAAADAFEAGAVWLQTGTVGPEAQGDLAARAAERGLLFVDAPVLGTRTVADAGELTVLAAGPDAARPVADQVFDAVGSRTIWLPGDAADGPASRLKLVLNNWVLALTAATGETLALAKALDVDPDTFFAAIEGGSMDTPYLRMKAAAILGGDFTPNFTVNGAAKDLRLIVAAGEAAGARMDLAAAAAARFERAADQGHGGEDMAAGYFASWA